MNSRSDIRAFADAGGAWAEPGEVATGVFCGLLAVGGSVSITSAAGDGAIVGLPTSFTISAGGFVPGKFTAVTNDAGSSGDLLCVNDVNASGAAFTAPTVA